MIHIVGSALYMITCAAFKNGTLFTWNPPNITKCIRATREELTITIEYSLQR